MKTVYRLVEIMYLVVAAISLFEVFAQWPEHKTRSAVFALFAVLGIFMYFFRRAQRRKMNN
jgi:hypothetical protein